MRRFIYFFPVPGVNPQMLVNFGVAARFSDGVGGWIGHTVQGVDSGPGGKTGCLVCAGTEIPEFRPERQRWIESEKFWVGLDQLGVGPEDLARQDAIQSRTTTLCDGNDWRIPAVLLFDSRAEEMCVNLPQAITLQGGKCRKSVVSKYAALEKLAWDLLAGFGEERTLPFEEAFDTAVKLLAVNYRIGPEEVSLLELLDVGAMARIFQLAIDWESLHAFKHELAVRGTEFVPAGE